MTDLKLLRSLRVDIIHFHNSAGMRQHDDMNAMNAMNVEIFIILYYFSSTPMMGGSEWIKVVLFAWRFGRAGIYSPIS
jgi:hypothetical protein